MQVKSDTKVLGIIGNPLAHSLSPQMHNRALEYLKLNYVYVPFLVDKQALKGAVEGLRALGIVGVNVTIPFKEAIIDYLDDLSEEAQWCRAVNVVKNLEGRLVGYNTDGAGFVASLEEHRVPLAGRNALVLGAGGAARAITYHLVKAGIQSLVLANRSIERAQVLAQELNSVSPVDIRIIGWDAEELRQAASEAHLLINTTPVGMYPEVGAMPPLDPDGFHPRLVVCDVVYNPARTELLRQAAARGAKTIDGVGMFVHQGALAFQLFTGVKAPLGVMREVVVDLLSRTNADR